MTSGRGKESFRVFTKQINELKRHTVNAIKQGQLYYYEQVESWFQDMLDYYGNFLSDERLDYELWYTRGEVKTQEILRILDSQYSFNRGNDSRPEEDDEDFEENDNTEGHEGSELLGIPIITLSECEQDGNARMRGQILLTIDELEDYLKDIPGGVVRGLVERFDDEGRLIGYSLCGLKSTD